jgi:hypothetical protein
MCCSDAIFNRYIKTKIMKKLKMFVSVGVLACFVLMSLCCASSQESAYKSALKESLKSEASQNENGGLPPGEVVK